MKKSILNQVVLVLLTQGLYAIYWLYNVYNVFYKENNNNVRNIPPIFMIILLILTKGWFLLYILYSYYKNVSAFTKKYVKHPSFLKITIVLSFFAFSIINFKNLYIGTIVALTIILIFAQININKIIKLNSEYDEKDLEYIGKYAHKKIYYYKKTRNFLIEQKNSLKINKTLLIFIMFIIMYITSKVNEMDIINMKINGMLAFNIFLLITYMFPVLAYCDTKTKNKLKIVNREDYKNILLGLEKDNINEGQLKIQKIYFILSIVFLCMNLDNFVKMFTNDLIIEDMFFLIGFSLFFGLWISYKYILKMDIIVQIIQILKKEINYNQ